MPVYPGARPTPFPPLRVGCLCGLHIAENRLGRDGAWCRRFLATATDVAERRCYSRERVSELDFKIRVEGRYIGVVCEVAVANPNLVPGLVNVAIACPAWVV